MLSALGLTPAKWRALKWLLFFQVVFLIYINFSICDFKRLYNFNGIQGDPSPKRFTKALKSVREQIFQNQHHLSPVEPVGKSELKKRKGRVSDAFLKAWRAYEKHAFGHDELLPVTNSTKDWLGMGLTIVDSIDTMYLMGHTNEYDKARLWIAENLDFDKNKEKVSIFETTIRALGGLVSIYELTHDKMYLDKAEQLGKKLSATFNSATGLPYKWMDMSSNRAFNDWCGATSLVGVGSVQMEFAALSEDLGNPIYKQKALKIFDVVSKAPKYSGLHPIFIDPETGTFQNTRSWADIFSNKKEDLKPFISVGSGGDSYYEYLLKVWILSGKHVARYKQMFNEAMDPIIAQLLKFSSPSKLLYLTDRWGEYTTEQMHHLACFSGGLFALAAYHNASNDVELHMTIGKELTYTCHEFYTRTDTKLGPEEVSFRPNFDYVPVSRKYYLRPETIESYFVLYWITGDPIYQEWGWEAFTAIEKYCRTPNGGYSGILDVTKTTVAHDDLQQSFFLAETLKYLYLLFSPRETLSLDEWVFNTEAHPLRVWKK